MHVSSQLTASTSPVGPTRSYHLDCHVLSQYFESRSILLFLCFNSAQKLIKNKSCTCFEAEISYGKYVCAIVAELYLISVSARRVNKRTQPFPIESLKE